MILRQELISLVTKALRRSVGVLLLGPRQCGKTTLARQVARERSGTHYFDLEDPNDVGALMEPMTALRSLRGLIIIDEVQRSPSLFPVLRVLADRRPVRTRFLLLGSASPDLQRQSSETLAGRIEIIEMAGFELREVGERHLQRLWVRGGFPPSYLARSEVASVAWRTSFIQTFLERDLTGLGFGARLPPATLRRFWAMVAHYHGQTWNASEIGRSLGVSDQTTRRYLDILSDSFMVRQLQPWFVNLGKRQVKAPKIYVRDTGLLHTLMGLSNHRELISHPKCGASWEGFAIEEVLRILRPLEAHYFGVHGQGEIDLLAVHRGKRMGFEMKYADRPEAGRFAIKARQDLGLASLWVIHPGARTYDTGDGVSVVALSDLPGLLAR